LKVEHANGDISFVNDNVAKLLNLFEVGHRPTLH
jgi:hypothetical protein